jgi:hypothetical protein
MLPSINRTVFTLAKIIQNFQKENSKVSLSVPTVFYDLLTMTHVSGKEVGLEVNT